MVLPCHAMRHNTEHEPINKPNTWFNGEKPSAEWWLQPIQWE